MRLSKLHFYKLLTIVTILMFGCNNTKKKVGGSCEYVSLTEPYRVSKIIKTNDTVNTIRFVNTLKPELIRELNQNQIKADIPEFNDALMRSRSKIYMITVDMITRGSCTPEIIRGIKLKN